MCWFFSNSFLGGLYAMKLSRFSLKKSDNYQQPKI